MAAIEIPKSVYDALRLPDGERETTLKEELAVALYERGTLSFGKARELANHSKEDFGVLLGERGVSRHYTETELDEDLEYGLE